MSKKYNCEICKHDFCCINCCEVIHGVELNE